MLNFEVEVNDAFSDVMQATLNNFKNNMPGTPFPEGVFGTAQFIIAFVIDALYQIATGLQTAF